MSTEYIIRQMQLFFDYVLESSDFTLESTNFTKTIELSQQRKAQHQMTQQQEEQIWQAANQSRQVSSADLEMLTEHMCILHTSQSNT